MAFTILCTSLAQVPGEVGNSFIYIFFRDQKSQRREANSVCLSQKRLPQPLTPDLLRPVSSSAKRVVPISVSGHEHGPNINHERKITVFRLKRQHKQC